MDLPPSGMQKKDRMPSLKLYMYAFARPFSQISTSQSLHTVILNGESSYKFKVMHF